jgi:S1-C subfamily serine protease
MEQMRRRFEGFNFPDEGWNFQMLPTPLSRRTSIHGATLEPVDELLRSHLEIPEEAGLVVRNVRKGSLAAKVGLKKNDIVLEIDGETISTPEEWKESLVQTSQIVIFRGGKKIEIQKSEDK